MIGDILQAVINECKSLLDETGAQIIFKTDFKSENLISYRMPLLMFEITDAPDSGLQIGGLSRVDWVFALNVYNQSANAYISEDGGVSTSALNIIDIVRQHFSKGDWLTTDMTNIENNYGFRFTLSGISGADAITEDGTCLGYKINFDSVGFDVITNHIIMSEAKLEKVEDNTNYNESI